MASFLDKTTNLLHMSIVVMSSDESVYQQP